MAIKLNNGRVISSNHLPYFVAELNTSHFGDLAKAKKMIDAAKESDCDCVKFQSWTQDSLYSSDFYNENPIAKRFIKKLSLGNNELIELAKYCKKIEIDFASTPYSINEVDFLLSNCDVPFIKVASMDINNLQFLRYIAKSGSSIVLSTGMAEGHEIELAVNELETYGAKNIVILHCISIYPSPHEIINLNNVLHFKTKYEKHEIGYSDHTLGIEVACASVSLGANMIEKHFTLDNSIIGFDNQMAIEKEEFKFLINSCKNIFNSLGIKNRKVGNEEIYQRLKMRRSLVAKQDINPGEYLSEENVCAKRPGTGISVSFWDNYMGKKVGRHIKKDTLIKLEDIV